MVFVVLAGMSCKKKEALSVNQRIQAKWLLETYVINSHYSGSDHVTTVPGSSADYVDFRSNNKVYTQLSGGRDTSTYAVLSDSTIKIDVDTYKILVLTDNVFKLYFKDVTSAAIYDETTINLKK